MSHANTRDVCLLNVLEGRQQNDEKIGHSVNHSILMQISGIILQVINYHGMYLITLMGHGVLEGRKDTSLEVKDPGRLRCFAADTLHLAILEGEAQGRLGNSSSELWSVRRSIKIDVGQLQWKPDTINNFQRLSAENSI